MVWWNSFLSLRALSLPTYSHRGPSSGHDAGCHLFLILASICFICISALATPTLLPGATDSTVAPAVVRGSARLAVLDAQEQLQPLLDFAQPLVQVVSLEPQRISEEVDAGAHQLVLLDAGLDGLLLRTTLTTLGISHVLL